MPALSRAEFESTLTGEMREIAPDDAPEVPLPTYRATIDTAELGRTTFASWPTTMRQTPDDRYTHVLYESSDENVFLVVVVDRARSEIVGHHVLDLNRLYGLSE